MVSRIPAVGKRRTEVVFEAVCIFLNIHTSHAESSPAVP